MHSPAQTLTLLLGRLSLGRGLFARTIVAFATL
jgi:hypothetical protein